MSRPLAGRALRTLDGAPTPAVPAGARFAVDRLDVDDELLTVEGRWSGIRGLRFLRPTLVVDGRPFLATLEHKPWAASEHERWTAAFPWSGDPERLRRAWLQVAPSVIVPLGDGSRARPAPAVPAAPIPKAEAAADASTAEVGAVAEQAPAEVTAAARELEHMRREVRSAQAERDRAEALRDEAVRDREAALRTRERMSRAHDETTAATEAAIAEVQRRADDGIAAAQRRADKAVAVAERRAADAERAREQAVAERDAARTDGDAAGGAHEQVRLQRDEALAAYRRVAEDAPQDPGAAEPPEAARPYPADEAPLGVSALTAVRARRPDTSRPRPQPGTLSAFDHWALRVLAITAASCFVLLMFLLVRVFS